MSEKYHWPSCEVKGERKCKDCGVVISEHASHTGNEQWCEDCFDKGLAKDMDDHFKNTVKTELEEDRIKNEIRLRPFQPLREVYTEFGGDPSDDKECYKRYCSTEPFKSVDPSVEVLRTRQVRFVRMKSLKELVRKKLIKIIHMSEDGEFMRYKVLPNGPEVGQWTSGDAPLLVVDCETVHANSLKMFPQLYEDVQS